MGCFIRERVTLLQGKRGLFNLCTAGGGQAAKHVEEPCRSAGGSLPQMSQIVQSKKIALRRGVWFRALSRVERGILDLTTKYVVRIKSAKLADVVAAILQKLQLASESRLDRLTRTVGTSLAQGISSLAQSWGNRLASFWGLGDGFARYLAAMRMNEGNHVKL